MEIKLTAPRRSAPWARWALPGKPSRPWGAPTTRIAGRYGRIARPPSRFHAPSVTVATRCPVEERRTRAPRRPAATTSPANRPLHLPLAPHPTPTPAHPPRHLPTPHHAPA